MNTRFLPFLGIAVLATACAPRAAAPARPDEAAIRTALEAQLGKFGPAIANKDVAAVANLFTEDGTWVLPDASTFTGRANIEAGAKAFFDSFESASMDEMTIDKLVVVSDSEAVTFVHGTYTMTEKGKPPIKGLNPFADLWKKGADGVWRVVYEVNANGPAPTEAAPKS